MRIKISIAQAHMPCLRALFEISRNLLAILRSFQGYLSYPGHLERLKWVLVIVLSLSFLFHVFTR